MSSQSSILELLPKGIDAFDRKVGEVGSLLIIPLTLIVLYEVVMRYLFNAPTIWGFEATTFLYGIHYMLGLAYTQVYGGHVKVDVAVARLPKRGQSIVAVVTNLAIFLPVFGLMTVWAFKYAFTSIAELETNSTSWAPPIYPIKTIMALTFLLLFIQGISELLKDLRAALNK